MSPIPAAALAWPRLELRDALSSLIAHGAEFDSAAQHSGFDRCCARGRSGVGRDEARCYAVSMEFGRFLDVIRAFERAQVDYILIGGVAVNLHGIVRATEDIDFFVRPEAKNIERLKLALRSLWNDPEIDEIRLEDFEAYPTVRYGPPEEELVIDILTSLGTAFRFEDLAAETLTVEGVPVRVATPATLVRMMQNTIRPIDKADAAALARIYRIGDH